jgi:hypothetical protein
MSRTITQADIDAAKAARPDRSYVILTPDDEPDDQFLFAVPRKAEYMKFREMIVDDDTKATAVAMVIELCAVVPTPADLAAITLDHPGYTDAFGNQLLKLAGFNVGVTVKKV